MDKFFEATQRSRASQKHQYRALFDVCCALTTQGIAAAADQRADGRSGDRDWVRPLILDGQPRGQA
ncbi:MAG: hypothetical protein M3186_04330 [Actinomycetota bacterium]|nr:hypothetical protein [Actinomycetota bacterium]